MVSINARYSPCFVVLACMLLLASLGCGSDQIDREVWIERGRTTLMPFKQELMGALMKGLEEGPESAIEVCQIKAPAIAGKISSPGVKVGRTSHKLRNQRNAPKPWMQPLLEMYVANPDKSDPEVVRLADGRIGYVEPIFAKSLCLACHGSDLPPSLSARIDEHYPHDQARGFENGDFRGLFWVEFSEMNTQ